MCSVFVFPTKINSDVNNIILDSSLVTHCSCKKIVVPNSMSIHFNVMFSSFIISLHSVQFMPHDNSHVNVINLDSRLS